MTHGLRYHPLHSVWRNMLNRCYNKKVEAYKRYGGNGVYVCHEWRADFKKFYDWCIANGWQKGLEIDKDLKGGNYYSPETCSIITPKENSNCRKSNVYYEINGVSKTLSQWADDYGVTYHNITSRLWNGFSLEEALSRAVNGIDRNRKVICVTTNETFNSVKEASNIKNIKASLIARVARGERNHTNGLIFKYLN